jgi:hypothetical protein
MMSRMSPGHVTAVVRPSIVPEVGVIVWILAAAVVPVLAFLIIFAQPEPAADGDGSVTVAAEDAVQA